LVEPSAESSKNAGLGSLCLNELLFIGNLGLLKIGQTVFSSQCTVTVGNSLGWFTLSICDLSMIVAKDFVSSFASIQ